MIECPLPSYFPKNTDDAPVLIRLVGTKVDGQLGSVGMDYAVADQGLSQYPDMLGNGGEYAYGSGYTSPVDDPFDLQDVEFYYWYTPAEDADLSLYLRGSDGTDSNHGYDLDYVAVWLDVPLVTNLKINKSRRRGRFL